MSASSALALLAILAAYAAFMAAIVYAERQTRTPEKSR